MELNRTMILLSGCFLMVWSTFKWKIPHVIWDVKLTRVCSVILGLYNIILAIGFEKDLSIFLFIVDLILYMLLDIGFLMVKLKKDKKEGKKKNLILWERAVLFGALIVVGIWKREKVKEIWKNLS